MGAYFLSATLLPKHQFLIFLVELKIKLKVHCMLSIGLTIELYPRPWCVSLFPNGLGGYNKLYLTQQKTKSRCTGFPASKDSY